MTTIKDIAKYTSRSISTVSVVLRGEAQRFGICAETEKEIRLAAARLGYVKNDFARTMASGKSRILGFISNSRSSMEYSGRLLSGALERASALGYALRVFRYADDQLETLTDILLSQKIQGILISGDLERTVVNRIIIRCKDCGIQCATVNLSNQVEGFGVVSDDAEGMRLLVCRLYEHGHRKIAMLSDNRHAEYAVKRRNGYREGIRQCGLKPQIFHRVRNQYPTLKELVSADFTAVMCDTDYSAANLMQQAYKEGIRVPDTISVCGFAGMQVADFAALPLTTVAQDFEGMGNQAAFLLIDSLEKDKEPVSGKVRNISLPVRIHIQKTTKGI